MHRAGCTRRDTRAASNRRTDSQGPSPAGDILSGTTGRQRKSAMIPLKVDILRTRAAICNGFLIILNVLVFFYELSLPPRAGESLIYAFGLIPSHTELLLSQQGITLSQAFLPLVTSMFLHGGWMHLLGNMLFLWVFGVAWRRLWGIFNISSFTLLVALGPQWCTPSSIGDRTYPRSGQAAQFQG